MQVVLEFIVRSEEKYRHCYTKKTDQGDDSLHLHQGCWKKGAKNSIL